MMNTFKNLRDLVGVISAYCRLEAAIVDELERQNSRLYALEKNQDMAKATRSDLLLRLGKAERSLFGKDQSPDKPTEKSLIKV